MHFYHYHHHISNKVSIAENLLRFVSKLFYKDGSGDPLYAPTYLREQGINKVPISETTSFTQETYVCAFPSLTSFTPNVNVLSDVFFKKKSQGYKTRKNW
jgi:hypothetical protein